MLTKNSFVNYPKSRNNQRFSVESANFSNLCIPTIPKTYDMGFFVKTGAFQSVSSYFLKQLFVLCPFLSVFQAVPSYRQPFCKMVQA